MSFKATFLCSWWGSSHLGAPAMLRKIADAGYDGVEIAIPSDEAERRELRALLTDHNLAVVAHQYAPAVGDFECYHDTYRANLETSAAFAPILINSHTGSDRWSFNQNCALVESAAAVSESYNVPIVHETHRGRFLYSAAASAAYFDRFPDLRVTADFGHWTCVAGGMLEDQQDLVERAIQRADHLHARVGFADGPQVLEPFSAMWSNELARFWAWWRAIVDRRRADGHEQLTITLEAGPVMTGDRIAATPEQDFWASNLAMRSYLASHLDADGVHLSRSVSRLETSPAQENIHDDE